MSIVSIIIPNSMSIFKSTDFVCKSTPSYLTVRTHFLEHYDVLSTHYLMEIDVSFHRQYSYSPTTGCCSKSETFLRPRHEKTLLPASPMWKITSPTYKKLNDFRINHLCQSFSLILKKLPTTRTYTNWNSSLTRKSSW